VPNVPVLLECLEQLQVLQEVQLLVESPVPLEVHNFLLYFPFDLPCGYVHAPHFGTVDNTVVEWRIQVEVHNQ
jgi:hypothetical protein